MSTQFITRVAVFFMCFFLLAPDAIASAGAIAQGMPWFSLYHPPQEVEEMDEEGAEKPETQPLFPIQRIVYPEGRGTHRITYGPRWAEVFEQAALLGQSARDPMNNPRDDFFSFDVQMEDFERYTHAIVRYEVKGVNSGKGLVKAVNDMPSFGELDLLEPSNVWSQWQEIIPIEHLIPGRNLMRFSLPKQSMLQAEVREFSVQLTNSTTGEGALPYLDEDLVQDSTLFSYKGDQLQNVRLYSASDVQVPSIPTDITNVTKGAYAYRIRTDEPLLEGLIGVAIDLDRIPAGKTPRDVSTFYFNYGQRGWVPVSVDSVHIDNANNIAINFVPLQPGSQYFNGVINTPNMPESSANLNTSLAPISAPNPSTGIASIAPPQLSRTGDASTSFPIKIPAGRNGMQPSAAITYNSSSGTGWLGVGWNFSVPKIIVDTRWGVPEFDEAYETEIYSLDGQVLNHADNGRPNRIDLNEPTSSLPARSEGPALFFESVRRTWREVKRVGIGPDDYTWEVTTADQTKYYYGLRDAQGSIINSSVLRDPATGNIAEWNLSKVKDKWGNVVQYHYDDVTITGTEVPSLLVNAEQRTLNRITYTGYDDGSTTTLGEYAIYFQSDATREDATIHMRYGFKVANASKLNGIVVQYGATNLSLPGGTGSTEIRNYQLNYRTVDENTFYKNQLSSISERKGSNVFYTYDFEYFNPSFEFDSNAEDITGSTSYNELGRTQTEGYSLGGAAGVGFGGNPKSNYVGAEYNHSWSDEWMEYTMLDVTGDGIPDAIHSTAGNVQFNRGYHDDNGNFKLSGLWESFTGQAPSYRLHSESVGDQYSITGGFGAFGANFTAGVAYNNSVSHTRNYFTDINSDGIMDWVANGEVSFGRLDIATGGIHFEDDSRNTPNPIINLVDITAPEEDGLETQSFETVRSWRAPFDGFVSVTSSATLNGSSDDFVYLQVDHDQGHSSVTLATTPTLAVSTPTSVNLSNIEVARGDMLFFRVNGLQNPDKDFVSWDPQISYSSGSLKDANGIDYGIHSASEQYTLYGNDKLNYVEGDNVSISWPSTPLNSPTDAVTLEVVATLDNGTSTSEERAYYTAAPNFNGSAPSSSSGSFVATSAWIEDLIDGTSYTVPTGNTLSVRLIISSRTNVKWSLIDWRPTMTVTANNQTKTVYPVVEKQFYGDPLRIEPPASFSAMQAGMLHVVPDLDIQLYSGLPLNQGTYEADFTIKTQGAYVLSYHIEIDPNQQITTVSSNDNLFEPLELSQFILSCSNGSLIEQLDFVNDEIFFEFTTSDETLAEQLKEYANVDCYLAEIQGENCVVYNDRFRHKPSVYLKHPYDFVFSNVQGWGVFGWAGNSDPLEEEKLEPMPTNDPQFEQEYAAAENGTLEDYVTFTENNDIGPFSTTHLFRAYVPQRGESVTNTYYSPIGTVGTLALDRWHMVFNEFGSVFKSQTSNGVTGVDPSYVAPVPDYARVNDYNRSAVVSRSVAHNASVYGSGKFKLEAGGGSVSANIGGSTTYPFHNIHGIGAFQREAMFDINGDGYPDVVASNDQKELRWSPTNPLGGYEISSMIELDNNAYISRNKFTSAGPRIGLGYASGDQSTQFSAGGSGSRTLSTSVMLNGLLDFNGDGLPDFYISPDTEEFGASTNSRIRLGNGDGLSSAITLSDTEVSYTSSTGDAYATGGSLGSGMGFGGSEDTEENMFDFSVSGNYSWHNQYSERMFRDMNKDGLPDLVYKSGSAWRVKLNTGTGFSTSKSYTNSNMDFRSETQNLVIATRIGFFIPLPNPVVSSINVGANGTFHNGGSDVHSSLQDMNGDGYPDLVYHDGNEVQVRYNLDGKAGLLRSIKTPLGAEISMDYELKGNRYGMYPTEVSNHQFEAGNGEPDIFWDMAYSKWVLASVSVDDGFNPASVNDGADVYTTHFAYDGGMHSRRERKFIGFTRIASYSDFREGQDAANLTLMNIPADASISLESGQKIQKGRVIDYVKVSTTDYQERVAYEYQSSLIEASYQLLNTSVYNDLTQTWDDTWLTMSVDRNTYDYFTWNQIGEYVGEINPVKPDLNTISEIECFNPRITDNERISFINETRYFNAVKTSFSYDEYSNTTRIEIFGQDEVSVATLGDSPYSYVNSEGQTVVYQWYDYSPVYVADIIVLKDYYHPSNAANRVGVLSRSRLFTQTTALSNLKRVTRYALDGSVQNRAIGTITKFLDVNETNGATITYSHDNVYGNILNISPQQKADGDELDIDITYDATLHQYPISVQRTITDVGGTNSSQETVLYNYELASGLLRKMIDENGLPTEYYYDDFQRPIKIFGPRELEQGPYSVLYEYFDPASFTGPLTETNLPWSIAHQYIGNAASETELGDWRAASYYSSISASITDINSLHASSRVLPSTFDAQSGDFVRSGSVIDGLGRSIQTTREVSQGNAGTNEKALLFSGRAQYDIWGQPMIGYRFGRVISTSYNAKSLLQEFHDDVNDQLANVQSFSYTDQYGRVSESWGRNGTDINASSANVFTRSTAAYEWVIDPQSGYKVLESTITLEGDPTSVNRVYTDSRGRNYRVEEVDVNKTTPEIYATSYSINLINEVESVTDPMNFTTTYTYDLFGRLVATNHPDKGTLQTNYDIVGNIDNLIIQDADDESQTITMDMEYAYNRLIEKTFPESGTINNVSVEYGSPNDGLNGAGRPVRIVQGSANSEVLIDEFAYDDLGNRVREQRQIAVPFAGEYTFKSDYTYDSWGRVNNMRYPDGEVVNYDYAPAGELESMTSDEGFLAEHDGSFIHRILYDGWGSKARIDYGNGVTREFTFDEETRALQATTLTTSSHNAGFQTYDMLDKTFEYNSSGNISGEVNTAGSVGSPYNDLGGYYDKEYTYDAFNRLTYTEGGWNELDDGTTFTLQMSYDQAGRITQKNQQFTGNYTGSSVNLTYTYGEELKHYPTAIQDNSNSYQYTLEYDHRGNMVQKQRQWGEQLKVTQYMWDEADRMIAASEENGNVVQHNVYDYNGTRIMRGVATNNGIWEDNEGAEDWTLAPYTIYAAPHYVFEMYQSDVDVTKHYYGDFRRVASRTQIEERYYLAPGHEPGMGPFFNQFDPDYSGSEYPSPTAAPINNIVLTQWDDISEWQANQNLSTAEMTSLGIIEYTGSYFFYHEDCSNTEYPSTSFEDEFCQCRENRDIAIANGISCLEEYPNIFLYHGDQGGSTEFVTDLAGMPYEHYFYAPFGEVIVSQHANNDGYSNPYKFVSSEHDAVTGLVLMGHRYYDPTFSIWVSPDPLFSIENWLSPYVFSRNNPVMLFDPMGLTSIDKRTGPGEPPFNFDYLFMPIQCDLGARSRDDFYSDNDYNYPEHDISNDNAWRRGLGRPMHPREAERLSARGISQNDYTEGPPNDRIYYFYRPSSPQSPWSGMYYKLKLRHVYLDVVNQFDRIPDNTGDRGQTLSGISIGRRSISVWGPVQEYRYGTGGSSANGVSKTLIDNSVSQASRLSNTPPPNSRWVEPPLLVIRTHPDNSLMIPYLRRRANMAGIEVRVELDDALTGGAQILRIEGSYETLQNVDIPAIVIPDFQLNDSTIPGSVDDVEFRLNIEKESYYIPRYPQYFQPSILVPAKK